MKILVTGGSGFIGSTFVRLALARGHKIINIDALSHPDCLDNLADVKSHNEYNFVHADIRDRKVLDSIFDKYEPCYVMHFAAETHVDESIDEPSKFIETNVTGTLNLLECSRDYWNANNNIKSFRFHHVSTDEVYGTLIDGSEEKFTEGTAYNPQNPYAATKASANHLVQAWHNTYSLPTIITNSSNNFGPYQFPEKLIPVSILRALAEESIIVYGDGGNIRDWLFVDDHAEALLLLTETENIGRTYNIGGNKECTNLEVIKTVCGILDRLKPRFTGPYADLITFVQDRPGHDRRYAVDTRRIREELSWTPKVRFTEGLEKTVKWYLDNQNWWHKASYHAKLRRGLRK